MLRTVEAGLQRKAEGNEADFFAKKKKKPGAIGPRESAWGSACQLPLPSPSEASGFTFSGDIPVCSSQ